MRPLLSTALAAVLVLAPAAVAAPSCKLVTDAGGDGGLFGAVAVKPLDIRSLDVATGAKTLVVVLRMTTTKQDDPLVAAGMAWDVTFKIGDTSHRFARRIGPNGAVLSDTATAGSQPVSGVKVRADGSSITWTVPRANVPKLRGRGATFSGFFASTSSPLLGTDQMPDGGRASSATYKDRAKSCVKAA